MKITNPISGALLGILEGSRVMSTSTGDVDYTGLGFTPKSWLVLAAVDGTKEFSFGTGDSAGAEASVFQDNNEDIRFNVNHEITIYTTWTTAGTNGLFTAITDGIRITWTKIGSPTATIKFIILCFG